MPCDITGKGCEVRGSEITEEVFQQGKTEDDLSGGDRLTNQKLTL